MTIQQTFAENTVKILRHDDTVLGLAAAGSWITGEMDDFSDLDLIIVTKEKVGGDKQQMLAYASRFGKLLSGFTGEHVGEPRVLICLYDNPLLHVDLKFVTLEEFRHRIETPVLLLDKIGELQEALDQSEARFPYPDHQWIEDRFWTWVHYALLKIGRGELMEAFDFLGYLRMVVFGPLLHIRNNNLPRGVRKVEVQLSAKDLAQLKATIPSYDPGALLQSLENAVELYRELRDDLFSTTVSKHIVTEEKVMHYFLHIKQRQRDATGPDSDT
ncbi:MAG: nucleotidyltransferase domain-containing protein [Chitinophagaceae bacterium]|nr:MAG: nucleotidyltransferase domain-containing protein [Chitinophagaceae bacterium]